MSLHDICSWLKFLQPCTFGIVSIQMENDFLSFGFRHDSILLVYIDVWTVDWYVCVFANKYI